MKENFQLGFGLAVLSALGFSCMPIFTKLIYQSEVNVVNILALRFTLAALFLWTYLYFTGKDLRVKKEQLIGFLLLGILGYGSMSTCYFLSLQYISACMVALLLYLYPSFVTILAFFFLKEKITYSKIGALFLSLTGMAIILWSPSGMKMNSLGVFLGIVCAIIYSVYIVIGGKQSQQSDPQVFSAYIITGAALGFDCYGLFSSSLSFSLSAFVWFSIAMMALVSTVLAIITFFAAVRKIGASKASIISSFEPLFTTALAIIFLGEKITIEQLSGGLLILISVILLQEKKENKQPCSES